MFDLDTGLDPWLVFDTREMETQVMEQPQGATGLCFPTDLKQIKINTLSRRSETHYR